MINATCVRERCDTIYKIVLVRTTTELDYIESAITSELVEKALGVSC